MLSVGDCPADIRIAAARLYAKGGREALGWRAARAEALLHTSTWEAMMSLIAFLPTPPTAMSVPKSASRESKPNDAVTSASAASFRQQVTSAAHTVVVKVGTRVLTQADGTLNHKRIEQLAEEIHAMHATGRRTVLVSSGAVGAGVGLLGLKGRPTDLAKLQAVAAVGQTHLIQSYDRVFAKHGRRAAQVLLTIEDVDDRLRYLNVRNT